MATLTTVFNQGLDALGNLFEVNIPLDNISQFFGGLDEQELKFRIEGFEVPSSPIDTYDINWGPWTLSRPGGKITTDNTISFDIRIDREYKVYQGFLNWKNAIQNEYTGAIADIRNLTTPVSVYPITSALESGDYVLQAIGQGAVFEHAWCSEVGSISYDHGSGDPLTVSITLTFLRIRRDFNVEAGETTDFSAEGDDAQ